MERIQELISDEKYQEALKLLLQVEKRYLEKIQCLYELEKYDELLTFYDSIKKDIDEDYYEIFGFVINALIAKEDYDAALDLLNEELTLPYIPQDYQEIINDLYDDIVAIKQVYLHENNAYQVLNDDHVKDILEKDDDYFNLYEVIIDLNKYNLRSLINSVEIFLKRDVSNILKTLLLEECLRQEINRTLLVIKNNIEYEFLPSANEYVEDENNYLKTVEILVNRLDKTPSFLEMALTLLASYSYIIYPLTIEEDESLYLALVIEYYVCTLNLEEANQNYEELGFSGEKIEAGFEWLENILKSESEYEHGLDKYQF